MKVNYAAVTPTSTFDSPGTTSAPAKGQLAQFKEDPKVGDFAKAFDDAEIKLSATYETPPQHHNPMELFATSCVWYGDTLTVSAVNGLLVEARGGLTRLRQRGGMYPCSARRCPVAA